MAISPQALLRPRARKFAALFAGFVFSLYLLSFIQSDHIVSLTEAQIQSQIDRREEIEIPAHGVASVLLKSVKAQAITVRLHDGAVEFSCRAVVALRLGKEATFDVSTVGAPRYSDGEFYFDPTKVVISNLNLPTNAILEALKHIGRRPAPSADDAGDEHRLRESAQALATHIAKTILARRPVYRLKDDFKGYMIGASLQSVTVNDDRLDIAFTLKQIGATALAGVILLLAVAAGVVVVSISADQDSFA
jgi:hypothetical protein